MPRDVGKLVFVPLGGVMGPKLVITPPKDDSDSYFPRSFAFLTICLDYNRGITAVLNLCGPWRLIHGVDVVFAIVCCCNVKLSN